jgi:hypothetical protein
MEAVRQVVRLAAAVVAAGLLAGCASVQRMPGRMLAGSLSGLGASLQAQPDPELVRQGAPTFMLLLDGLLVDDPENPRLLLVATQSYVFYAQAFASAEAAPERAVRLWGRAHDYGQRLLSLHPVYRRARAASPEAFEAAVNAFGRPAVPELFTAGVAWAGWIAANPNSMRTVSELPQALTLLRRVLELDDTYQGGATHLLFGIYYAVQAPGAGQDLGKSRHEFERATALAGPGALAPRVAMAEYYARAAQDRKLFVALLTEVTGADPAVRPDVRLSNALAVEQARRLLERQDEFFDTDAAP